MTAPVYETTSRAKFEIAGIKVEPGTTRRGYLRVGPYFRHKRDWIRSFVNIPFTVIRGSKDGPTLLQTAGAHPTEYTGIDGTIKLSNTIKAEDLSGMLITIPCCNVLGFWARSYINPVDGKNLHESYPGRTDGTISDLIAYKIFNEMVLKADYFLDCHGSDLHESIVWCFTYYKTDDDIEQRSQAIGRAAQIRYFRRVTFPGKLGHEAAKRGIPGGLLEFQAAGDKLLSSESSWLVDISLNVMRHLGMLEGSPQTIAGPPFRTEGQEPEVWTSSASTCFTKGGLYRSEVKAGDFLKEGQVIGTVVDFWGDTVETIRAPATGRVMTIVHNPVVLPGEEAITVFF